MPIRRASFIVAALLLVSVWVSPQHAAAPPTGGDRERTGINRRSSAYWLDVRIMARSLLIDPARPAQLHEVMDDATAPQGVLSPDGKRIAFIASDPERVKAGHEFDLFVAEVDPATPSGKAGVRRLTTDQIRPTSVQWLATSDGVVFLAGDERAQQVWYRDLGADSRTVRLSDGGNRCSDIAITAESRVVWIAHKGVRNKQQFDDLMLHPSLQASGHMRTLLTDQHISSYAISPDEKTLAWSGLGSMFLVNLETSESREIPLHGIHRQLLNHTVHQFAWRPDGKVIAIHCGFLGGVAVGPGEKFPRMFAEDKVFFVPVDWTPAPQSLTVGEGADFPSPAAVDPAAEISPPAGDESRPWWVRELPMRPLVMRWIGAERAATRLGAGDALIHQ